MTSATTAPDSTQIIRQTLAALAYRANRVLDGVPDGYAEFDAGQGVMTPRKMLAHMSGLMAYSLAQLTGSEFQRPAPVDSWAAEVDRFFEGITALDRAAAAGFSAPPDTVLRMLQGPILDAMTHVGQLSMLRRLAGYPTPKDHYIKATITIGRTGKDQAPPAA